MALSVGRVFGLLELQDQFSGRLEKAAAELTQFQQRVEKFNTASIAKQLDDFGQKAMKAGGTLTAAITLPLAGLAAGALKAGLDFEGAMNRVQAATDAPAGEMQKLRDAAMKMGADTTFSATEAAQAMVELGKAGFDSTQSISALPSVLQLATAGQMELADAATLTSNTMKTFGLNVNDLAHANDVLAKAANLSTIDVRDLAEGFKYVGPVAHAAGVSLETVSASMALLGEAGIKGSMAGTTLRNVMTTLMSPTDKQAGLMKELGLQSAYANGKLMDMPAILKILESQTGKNAEILELFGDRAGPGMVALVEKGGGALSELRKNLDDTGYAARNAEKLMQGLPGAMEELRGSVETAFIALNKALEPAFMAAAKAGKALADFATNTLIPAFSNLPAPVQLGVIAIAAMAAAAGPLLIALGAMASGLSTLLPLWTLAQAAAFAFGNTIPVLTARLWLMEAAQKAVAATSAALEGTMGAAFLGVGGTVVAVGAAIAGIVAGVYQVVEAVKALVQHLKEGKSAIEFFTKKDNDNWLRRGLGLSTENEPTAPNMSGGGKKGDVNLPLPQAAAGAAAGATAGAAAFQSWAEQARKLDAEIRGLANKGLKGDLASAINANVLNVDALAKKYGVSEEAIKRFKDQIDKQNDAAKASAKVWQDYNEKQEKAANKERERLFVKELETQAIRDATRAGQQQLPLIERTTSAQDTAAEKIKDITKSLKDGVTSGIEPYTKAEERAKAMIEMANDQLKRQAAHAREVRETMAEMVGTLDLIADSVGGKFGGFVKGLADIADGWMKAAKAVDNYRSAQNVAQKAMAVAQGAMATWNAAGAQNRGQAVAGGALAGAQAGMMFGPWGAAIGGAAGAIAGFVRSAGQGRDAVKKFAESFGGFDALQAKLATMGERGNKMWIALTQGVGKNNPQQAQMVIEQITEALRLQGDAAAEAANQTVPSFADVQAAAERYGLSVYGIGDAINSLRVKEQAEAMIADWNLLSKAGADMTQVAEGMADEVQGMVDEALKYGHALPEAMRPMLEKMVSMGKLTDAAGNKLEDLEGITWTKSIESAIDGLIGKLDELIDKINSGVGGALNNLGNARPGTGASNSQQSPNTGAAPRPETNGYEADGSSKQGVANVYLDGRKVGRIVAPHIAGEMSLQGI